MGESCGVGNEREDIGSSLELLWGKVVKARQDLCSNCGTNGKSGRLQKRYGLRGQGYSAG